MSFASGYISLAPYIYIKERQKNDRMNEIKLLPNKESELGEPKPLDSGQCVCSICLKEKSQYTCPRCNIKYCSLNCYKDEKHSSCSELFYKDWVMQELQETKTRPGDREKMYEMLSRLENENPEDLDSDDDEEEEDLETRLNGLDLDDSEAVLNKLTSKERAEFEKLLKEGHVGNLVEVWTPWWKETKELIEEIDEKEKKSKKQTKNSKPKLLKNIPDINTLIKTKPSPDIRNNMINILYSYAFVCRLHNGGHFDCPVNSAEDLLNICCVLSEGRNFISLEEAVEETIQKLHKDSKRLEISGDFILDVLEDVECIIKGLDKTPSLQYILLSLSEVIALFKSARTLLKKEIRKEEKRSEESSDSELKTIIHQCEKKCVFLLSWCQRYGMALVILLPELQLEISRKQIDLKQVEDGKTKLEENWGGTRPPPKKELISELK